MNFSGTSAQIRLYSTEQGVALIQALSGILTNQEDTPLQPGGALPAQLTKRVLKLSSGAQPTSVTAATWP